MWTFYRGIKIYRSIISLARKRSNIKEILKSSEIEWCGANKNWAYLSYLCWLFYRRFIRKMTICQNYSLTLKEVKVAIPGDSWIKNILKFTVGIKKIPILLFRSWNHSIEKKSLTMQWSILGKIRVWQRNSRKNFVSISWKTSQLLQP